MAFCVSVGVCLSVCLSHSASLAGGTKARGARFLGSRSAAARSHGRHRRPAAGRSPGGPRHQPAGPKAQQDPGDTAGQRQGGATGSGTAAEGGKGGGRAGPEAAGPPRAPRREKGALGAVPGGRQGSAVGIGGKSWVLAP